MTYHGFFVLLRSDWGNLIQDILEISRHYALILYVRSLRNFNTEETREVVMVSTHMRGAVILTSVSKGFLRACTLRSVAYSPTYSWFYNEEIN